MGKDKFGTRRGKCSICEECYEYTAPVDGISLACEYCDHKPIYHVEIVTLGTCGCGKCHGYASSNECQYPSCDYCDCGADKHIGYDKVETELAKAKQRLKPIVAPVVKPQEPIATPQAQISTSGQSDTQYGLQGYMPQPMHTGQHGSHYGMLNPPQQVMPNPQMYSNPPQQVMPNTQMYQNPPQQGMPNTQMYQNPPQQGMPNTQMYQNPPQQGMPNTHMYQNPPQQVMPKTQIYPNPPQQVMGQMYQNPPHQVMPNSQMYPNPQAHTPTNHPMSGMYSQIPQNMYQGGGSNQGAGGNSGSDKCLRSDCNRPKRQKEDGSGYYDYCGKYCSTKK